MNTLNHNEISQAMRENYGAVARSDAADMALHPSIVALISLAANIASNHPKQGLCQVDRLKQYGVEQVQIDAVVEIARHLRDEAAQSLDARFDEACSKESAKTDLPASGSAQGACCAPTKSGLSCCPDGMDVK